MTSAAEGLFTVLFPSDCRLCGAPLQNISRLPVCQVCLDAMAPLHVPVCRTCGERLQAQELAHGDAVCGRCRQFPPRFEKALAYGSYDTGLRELIQLLKYQRVRPAAGVLGRMLGEVVVELAAQNSISEALVVPVPLHPAKLRQRGFNQSELIARAALKNLRGQALAVRALPGGVLERVRETQSQTGLTPPQRLANVRGAFAVARPQEVRGRDIVLVDDVFTTGTTVSECARVLRRAGARRVLVATVARALKPDAAVLPAVDAAPQKEAVEVHA